MVRNWTKKGCKFERTRGWEVKKEGEEKGVAAKRKMKTSWQTAKNKTRRYREKIGTVLCVVLLPLQRVL